ncbi:MAG: hypothetical protein AAGA54_21480 [Myxococcota bacterium]
MKRLLLSLPLLATMACDDSQAAAAPRSADAQVDAAPARKITLEGDLSADTIRGLGAHLEGLADISSVSIEVEQTNDGPTRASITVAGNDLPSAVELRDAVSGYDGIGSAAVAIEGAEAPVGHGVDVAAVAGDQDKSPEAVKAEVLQKLRADGVEGDVHVDVIDDDGERRVEVRVEQTETKTE